MVEEIGDSTMLDIICPTCQKLLHVPAHFAGSTGKCTQCGGRIIVPGPGDFPGGRTREDILREQRGEPISSGFEGGAAVPVPDGVRLGAGMVASETERGGRARASIMRMIVLAGLLLVVLACVLPAIVIGYSAETKPPDPVKKPVLPVARGVLQERPLEEAPRGAEGPAEGDRQVYVTNEETFYHEASCAQLGETAAEMPLKEALAASLKPCVHCIGAEIEN